MRHCFSLCRSRASSQRLLQVVRTLSIIPVQAMEGSNQKSKLQVNVDVTSDVICPWCWIGKKHLDTAVKHLGDDFEFNIRWKPFLLNPYIPDDGMPLRDYCRLKFGDEAAERFLSGSSPVAQQGKSVGITFNHNRLVVSTKKPHILLDYASKEGKQHTMQEVLFRAYFTDGQNVSSDDVLKELAREVGLNVDKAMQALSDTETIQEFEKGVKDAQTKGITGVPFFEISLKDNPAIKQAFSGAQAVDTFVRVFSRMKTLSKV